MIRGPKGAESREDSLRYVAVAMSMILVWSLINQISVLGLISGVVAALAGSLAWLRSSALGA